ncbi:hypothetical protein EGI16_05905 [Chryseobacterium sp. G0240]|uniref:hypothetical protein n=1 Tax=Chryseobacterium sp. G0240 TaxID=2487066 RepID=UPI000F459112|nr:hypothetical protein [Chryseobacterium sp. G0240]ROI05913.1 hypothetical protein EGI16_05905 [Chryseobacterium sp. G0240]
MKCTLSLLILGLTVLSCKKEPRTERPLTTDSIIIDTVPSDTISGGHIPFPASSDTIRHDSIIGHQSNGTAKTPTNRKK